MTPPNETHTEDVADTNVEQILENHPEALIIYADPDLKTEGEFNISAFLKLENTNSQLSAYLARLLQQLNAQCSSVTNKTTISS